MIPAIARIGRATFVLGIGATTLHGCPMYTDECESRDDCAAGFYCERFSQRCQPLSGVEPVGCTRPDHCGPGETCTPDFACRPGSCDYHGCASGYACRVVDGAHTCVAGSADASAPIDASAGDAAR
jgi:hypothetical protein